MSMIIKELNGKIKLLTGLHIGCGDDSIHIGGIDNPVIKNWDGLPYIPGSSLKGKIRSLLELQEGISKNGEASNTVEYPDSLIPRMFGDTSGKNLTRVLFRDSFLSKDSLEMIKQNSISVTENKSENSINRLTSVASNPRNTERIIPGLTFDFNVVVRILDADDENAFVEVLKRGIELLEKDALGASGSRGYGKVSFTDLSWNGNPLN